VITVLALAAVIVGQAQVTDGDTIRIGETRIRLHGIDAPEAREQCVTIQAEVWRCGRSATRHLRKKIEGKTVTCEPIETDRYGRTVARCLVGSEDLQRWLVRNGWARSYPYFSHAYVEDEAAAKRHKHGIWQ
jgi:endonuclease YncB( thermonuclease family)